MSFDAGTSRLTLSGYRYLPRVRVSGTLQVTAGPRLSGTLRVSGGGTAPAVLQVSANGEIRVSFGREARRSQAAAAVRVEPFRLVRVPRAQAIDP